MTMLCPLACFVVALTGCSGPSSPAQGITGLEVPARAPIESLVSAEPKAQVLEAASPISAPRVGENGNKPAREAEFTLDAERFERGESQVPLWIPRDEELSYVVSVDLPILGKIEAGKVVLSSGVDRHVQGLPTAGALKPHQVGERGWIRCVASGSAAGYVLEQELKTRVLPEIFPHYFYTDTQTGSENRLREVKIGVEDDKTISEYLSDGHCKGCDLPEHFVSPTFPWGNRHHCDGCKRAEHRVMRAPQKRAVPKDTVDMLCAVYLARMLVRDEKSELSIPLLDRDVLWDVHLSTGEHKRLKTKAGSYDCVEVKLDTKRPPSEPPVKGGFEGLFGIRGQLHLWMDEKSGVPVLIQGELPVPVIGSLDVLVQLEHFKGTPKTFIARD